MLTMNQNFVFIQTTYCIYTDMKCRSKTFEFVLGEIFMWLSSEHQYLNAQKLIFTLIVKFPLISLNLSNIGFFPEFRT